MQVETYETVAGDFIVNDRVEDSPIATLKIGSELRGLNEQTKQYFMRQLTLLVAEVLQAGYINK